ncbi:MAG: DUF1338 family protein, partial [Rhodospirillaceae bacterium]
MSFTANSSVARLLDAVFPSADAHRLLAVLEIHPDIMNEAGEACSRAVISQALNIGLLHDLLGRVPTAKSYVNDLAESGGTLVFDHGALRTVDLDGMGDLPRGEESITRLLTPMGYVLAGTYPLDKLKMTGRAYKHRDYPEQLPQFFVSELHVGEFSEAFEAAVKRVTSGSIDPLESDTTGALDRLSGAGSLPFADSVRLLRAALRCFSRQHPIPALSDYETLLAESPEMAWIATEGNAFNHATNRVASLEAVVKEQVSKGRTVKENIEVSSSGRVRQTAFKADRVKRMFSDDSQAIVVRDVPGSFFEFIERDVMPDS